MSGQSGKSFAPHRRTIHDHATEASHRPAPVPSNQTNAYDLYCLLFVSYSIGHDCLFNCTEASSNTTEPSIRHFSFGPFEEPNQFFAPSILPLFQVYRKELSLGRNIILKISAKSLKGTRYVPCTNKSLDAFASNTATDFVIVALCARPSPRAAGFSLTGRKKGLTSAQIQAHLEDVDRHPCHSRGLPSCARILSGGLLSALAAVTLAAGAHAQSPVVEKWGTTYTIPVCGKVTGLNARCVSHIVTDRTGKILIGKQPIGGHSPADLRSAYNITTNGSSSTIVAVVDGFGYPNAEADLGVYRAQWGLPACTTANGCFKKVNQEGQQKRYLPPRTPIGTWNRRSISTWSAPCAPAARYIWSRQKTLHSTTSGRRLTRPLRWAHVNQQQLLLRRTEGRLSIRSTQPPRDCDNGRQRRCRLRPFAPRPI